MPGAFKLDHLQSIQPILFWNFSVFFTVILGSHFLLSQRANNGKREFTQLQNWMRQRGLCVRTIQSGPFASLWATFIPQFFRLFHFYTGRPILITPGAINGKRGISPTLKLDETDGFQCHGHSIWTICIPLSHFCSKTFPTFSCSYWEANSYYPRGLVRPAWRR